MANTELLWSLIIAIISTLLAASSVFVAWLAASRSTRRTKRSASPEVTDISESPSHLARMAADQAELFSTLEKLTTTVKRLSSRTAMRDRREADQAQPGELEPPPKGTPKADLLRHYGMSGKVGPEFARAQLELEAKLKSKDRSN